MEKTLYGFNSSEDVIELQTKYTIFKRVANIVFQITFDKGFDHAIMTDAINKLMERNDCLRITFIKKGKETLQYFDDERQIGRIPYKKFEAHSDEVKFLKKFRKKIVSPYKGKTLEAVYATNPAGKECIFFKISHFVADQFAINLLVNDLCAVYDAMSNGKELPPMPGKFEDVLKKDIEYKNNAAATQKDHDFFKDLYTTKHTEHPMYCGFHGFNSDRWLKYKKKGMFSLPFLFVKCDTEGYAFTIPAAVSSKAAEWCEANQITMSCFFFYCMSIAASIVNGKEKIQAPLDLINCRGTLAENRCGGTKVQAISVYTVIDYEKTFNESVHEMQEEQNVLYRHTRLTYLDVQSLQHEMWEFPLLSQFINFSYSFIPMSAPEGISLQVHSNGKGALVAYAALSYDVNTKEITTFYDIQTKMITPQQMVDFQNLFVHVVEQVLANPDTKMNLIF